MPLLALRVHSHACVSPSVALTCVPRFIFLLLTFSLWGVSWNKADFVPLLKLFSPLTNTNEGIKDCFSGKPSEYSTAVLFFLLALHKYSLIYIPKPYINLVQKTSNQKRKQPPCISRAIKKTTLGKEQCSHRVVWCLLREFACSKRYLFKELTETGR